MAYILKHINLSEKQLTGQTGRKTNRQTQARRNPHTHRETCMSARIPINEFIRTVVALFASAKGVNQFRMHG